MSWTPTVEHLGVSRQQAPATEGSPCCRANIVDRQKLWGGSIYRGCAHCGNPVIGGQQK